MSKLFLIKAMHSTIFFFMTACLLYILYAGIVKAFDWVLLVALGAILLEGLVLILNHWQCPLTDLARKYGDERGTVTDIFLPKWMARHVFRGSTILFSGELVLLAFRYFVI
jgi:hypothetical protein